MQKGFMKTMMITVLTILLSLASAYASCSKQDGYCYSVEDAMQDNCLRTDGLCYSFKNAIELKCSKTDGLCYSITYALKGKCPINDNGICHSVNAALRGKCSYATPICYSLKAAGFDEHFLDRWQQSHQ